MKREIQDKTYFNIPKKLILEEKYKRLSSDAKLVYAYLITENKNATPEEILDFFGMSKKTLKKSLRELEQLNSLWDFFS